MVVELTEIQLKLILEALEIAASWNIPEKKFISVTKYLKGVLSKPNGGMGNTE